MPHSADCLKDVACLFVIVCTAISPTFCFPELIGNWQCFFENAASPTAIPPVASKMDCRLSYNFPLEAIKFSCQLPGTFKVHAMITPDGANTNTQPTKWL
jgi:hypothetical protein